MFEQKYKEALQAILQHGTLRSNRTAIAACSMFDIKLQVDVSKRYPILTGKYIDIDIVNAEFEWLLTGQTTTDLFKRRGIKIWDKWADDFGNLGPVYGHQLINFNSAGYNQLETVIESLKQEPFHRRHIISLWNPLQLKEMRLPPCYLYFQFYVQDVDNLKSSRRLNMFVVQRSGDMFAGIPYDICVFTNLLYYIARLTNLNPGIISHNIVDAHIYQDHFEGVVEYHNRPTHTPPIAQADLFGNIKLINYDHEGRIKINIAK